MIIALRVGWYQLTQSKHITLTIDQHRTMLEWISVILLHINIIVIVMNETKPFFGWYCPKSIETRRFFCREKNRDVSISCTDVYFNYSRISLNPTPNG